MIARVFALLAIYNNVEVLAKVANNAYLLSKMRSGVGDRGALLVKIAKSRKNRRKVLTFREMFGTL